MIAATAKLRQMMAGQAGSGPADGGETERLWFIPVLILAAFLFYRQSFPLDDAYITLHNARTLLAGGEDPVYADAGALTGATSAIHLMLVAGLGLLFPLEIASKLALVLAVFLYAAGLLNLFRRHGCPPQARFVLLIAGLFVGYLPFHLVNGLETGLALATITWALALANSRWLPLLCGAMPFVRPELAFLALPLMVRHSWMLRARPRQLFTAFALMAAGAVPWMALYLLFTGAPLPNTGAAKVFFFAEATAPLLAQAEMVAWALILALLGPLFLSVGKLAQSSTGRCGLAFLGSWLLVSGLTLPGGLSHNEYRYISLAVPVLLLGWAQIFAAPRPWHRLALAGISVWVVFTATCGFARAQNDELYQQQQQIAEIVKREVSPASTILIHDAGYLAWMLPGHRLVDAVGLKSNRTVGWREALQSNRESRGRSVAHIAAASGADYFVVLEDDPFWASLRVDLEDHGRELRLIGGDPRLGYALYRIYR